MTKILRRIVSSCAVVFLILPSNSFSFPLTNRVRLASKQDNSHTTITERYAEGQLLIKLKDNTNTLPLFYDKRGNAIGKGTRITKLQNIHLIELNPDLSIKEAIKNLSEHTEVEYVSPNYIYHKASVPNDLNTLLWAFNNTGQIVNRTQGTPKADINILSAWDVTTGSSNIVVAVLDSGIDLDHPDLQANIWTNSGESLDGIDNDGNGYIDDINGWDFVNRDNDPNDDDKDGGHGTMVAGIISAVGNNGIGIVGVTWNTKIMALKILDREGFGLLSEILAGIDYAIQKRVNIINASFTGDINLFEPLEKSMIKEAGKVGILFVTAAGNGGSDAKGDDNELLPLYPASYDLDNIISVAASDQDDKLAEFSNFGIISVDVAAPGTNIYSTAIGGSYNIASGTSFATPFVTGLASLILANTPSLTYSEIKARILGNVKSIASMKSKIFSGGRIDAATSLNAVNFDLTAPSTVSDLSTGVEFGPEISLMGMVLSSNEANLSWLAPGDDNKTGNAFRYDLRASTSKITADTMWERLGIVLDMPAPSAPGTKEEITVAGLASGTKYYFALKTIDESGNTSNISNVITAVTPGQVDGEKSGVCFITTITGR